jgi:putative transcriptional regulator
VAHEQLAAHRAQGGIQLLDRAQDELDAAIAARQRVEDGGVEDEYAMHPVVRQQRPVQGGMVVVAQVAAEPDQGGRHGGGILGNGLRDYNVERTMETVSLANHFLIAMPAMDDPNFSRTLTFICEHNADGAIGIIVNRPTDMNLAGLFDRVSIPLDDETAESRFADLPVYFGGPVQTDRGFVLHRPAGQWQSSLNISDSIALTSSRDILQAMGSTGEPAEVLVSLGYAGWTAGQLEWELVAELLADRRCRAPTSFSPRRPKNACRPRCSCWAWISPGFPKSQVMPEAQGSILAFDFGLKRIGVAIGTQLAPGQLAAARPLTTIAAAKPTMRASPPLPH